VAQNTTRKKEIYQTVMYPKAQRNGRMKTMMNVTTTAGVNRITHASIAKQDKIYVNNDDQKVLFL